LQLRILKHLAWHFAELSILKDLAARRLSAMVEREFAETRRGVSGRF